MLEEINNSLARTVELQSAWQTARSQIAPLRDQVLESAATHPYIDNSLVAEIAVPQAACLAQISIAAQTALAEVPWNAIGEAARGIGADAAFAAASVRKLHRLIYTLIRGIAATFDRHGSFPIHSMGCSPE
jgi:hypothetical protein